VLIALLSYLVATGVIQPPAGVQLPFINVRPRPSDTIKAVISFLLIFVWTPAAMSLTPDTPFGVAVILVPDATFLVAALVYLSDGFSRGEQ
jgi:hypothetical protein